MQADRSQPGEGGITDHLTGVSAAWTQGKGIFLVRDIHEVLERLESDEKRCKIASRPTPRIAQR